MVGWHHQLSGLEFEQTPEIVKTGKLFYCHPHNHKELDTTQQLNNNDVHVCVYVYKHEVLGIEYHCDICEVYLETLISPDWAEKFIKSIVLKRETGFSFYFPLTRDLNINPV